MSSEEIIEQIRRIDLSEPDFYGPQDAVHLATIEKLLNVRLPPSFRSFLVTYGGGGGFTGLFGNTPERLDLGCIVGDNYRAREKYNLPPHFILIEISPFGEWYCLDTNTADSAEENPVLMFPVDRQGNLAQPQQVASSFAEYFHNEMLDRLDVLREEMGGDGI